MGKIYAEVITRKFDVVGAAASTVKAVFGELKALLQKVIAIDAKDPNTVKFFPELVWLQPLRQAAADLLTVLSGTYDIFTKTASV